MPKLPSSPLIGPADGADEEWKDIYGRAPQNEAETRLDAVLPYYPRTLEYHYDFGDDWIHVLTLEAWRAQPVRGASYEILERFGAAPPEDCGGPHRFCELRDCLAKAKKEGVDLRSRDPYARVTDLDYALAVLGPDFNPRNAFCVPDDPFDDAEPDIER